MKLEIMPVDRSRQEEAKQLVLNGLKERFGYLDPTLNLDLEDIVANYNEKGNFFIGMIEGTLVCTGALTQESPTVGRVERMSVKKEYRRKGYAAQMLLHIEEIAKRKRLNTLVLETNKDWESAVQFYLSQNFIIHRTDDTSFHFIKYLCRSEETL